MPARPSPDAEAPEVSTAAVSALRDSGGRAAHPSPPIEPGMCANRAALGGEHLLDRLPGDAEFSCDLRLGDALFHQLLHEVATLSAELPRRDRVLDGLGSNFFDPSEDLFAARCGLRVVHA